MIIEQATAEEVVAYMGMWGWLGYRDDMGKPLCFSGFWHHSGRLWGFLHVFDNTVPPLSLVRVMKKKIEEVEGDVYAMCDDRHHPSAPRLLKLLGFVPTEEMASHMRVWKWQTR